MASPTDPSNPPPQDVDLAVRGTVPPGLSGRVVGIGRDGILHSTLLHGGRVSYRSRRLRTDTVGLELLAFGSSILAFGEDAAAYELSAGLDALLRVDLAGRGRQIEGRPMRDPATGELHLVARSTDGHHAHVVVSAGAFTRRSRPIPDVPCRVAHLALTLDRVVLVADGCVGVARRDGDARATWLATDVAAPRVVHAHDIGDVVALLVLSPALERWVLRPDAGTVERRALDDTPRQFAHAGVAVVAGAAGADPAPRWVWSTGCGTIGRHDVVDARNVHRSRRPHLPGDFVVVPDAARPAATDGGWLVGFVHDSAGTTTDLTVVDAADIARPEVATVRIPRATGRGFRTTWIPHVPR